MIFHSYAGSNIISSVFELGAELLQKYGCLDAWTSL